MSCHDKHIDRESHEFGHEAWGTIAPSLNIAILNHDVFSLYITEIPQPLPECLDLRPRSLGIADRRDISYSGNFRCLLRNGGEGMSK